MGQPAFLATTLNRERVPLAILYLFIYYYVFFFIVNSGFRTFASSLTSHFVQNMDADIQKYFLKVCLCLCLLPLLRILECKTKRPLNTLPTILGWTWRGIYEKSWCNSLKCAGFMIEVNLVRNDSKSQNRTYSSKKRISIERQKLDFTPLFVLRWCMSIGCGWNLHVLEDEEKDYSDEEEDEPTPKRQKTRGGGRQNKKKKPKGNRRVCLYESVSTMRSWNFCDVTLWGALWLAVTHFFPRNFGAPGEGALEYVLTCEVVV